MWDKLHPLSLSGRSDDGLRLQQSRLRRRQNLLLSLRDIGSVQQDGADGVDEYGGWQRMGAPYPSTRSHLPCG